VSKYILIHIISLFLLVLITSCSNTKFLTDNESLYKGAKIKIDKDDGVKVTADLKSELNEVLYPKVNTKVFGLKIPLSIYNRISEPKERKGFKNYLKYKLGEKPVLFKKENNEKVIKLLENRLEVNGFFNNEVSSFTKTEHKRTMVYYNIYLKKPYYIDTVIYSLDSSQLSKYIISIKDESLLKKGDVYTLKNVKAERNRIKNYVRNLGYYDYKSGYLLYKADTNGNKITFKVVLKSRIGKDVLKQYKINNINVYGGFKKIENELGVENVNNINYHYNSNLFVPKKILKNMFFRKDSLYSDSDYRKTLSYYYSLSIISLTSISFAKSDTNLNYLDVDVQLLKSYKNSLETKFTGFTKSNGFTGPSVEVIFSNKNIFRGAERLSFSVETGIEKQFAYQETSVDYIFRIAFNSSLKFPNFTPGLKRITEKSVLLPYSYVSTGVTFLKYKPSMDIIQTNLYYGYKWFPKHKNNWLFKPISFVYQKQFMNEGYENVEIINLPYVPYGMNDQFSLGSEITYTTSTKKISKTRNEFFYKSTLDIAGNLMYSLFKGLEIDNSEEPYKLMGLPFAQYARIEFDLRYYRKLKYENKIATRILTYFSIPYGNSTELPFFKKYFIGGPNSVRGFNTGSIGPGSYKSNDETYDLRVNNGDIRLEANLEYRFKIAGYFYGGVFVDAGNVWLKNEDTLRPGGDFDMDRFYKEIAVATGIGLRMDFNVIAIRLDLGTPLRKPYLPESNRWIYSNSSFVLDHRDMVLHFAIDYPF